MSCLNIAGRIPPPLRLALFSLLYFGGAWLGDELTFQPSHFCTFWPNSGLFVAVLLLVPARQWPLFVLAAAPANVAFDLMHGRPLWMSGMFTAANCTEAVIGASLVRLLCRTGFDVNSVRHLSFLALGSALAATAAGACVGSAAVQLAYGSPFLPQWLKWWSADLLGVVLVAPLTLALRQGGARRRLTIGRAAEFVLAGAAAVLVTWLVMRGGSPRFGTGLLLVPPLIWAGLRFGVPGAAAAGGAAAVAGVLALANNPVAGGAGFDPVAEGAFVQMFFALGAGISLVVAALSQEARQTRDRLVAMLQAIPDVLFELGADGTILGVRTGNPEVLFLPPPAFLGRKVETVMPPAALEAILPALEQARQTGLSTGAQYSLDMPAGTRWYELSVARSPGASGEEPRLVALVRDITERRRVEDQVRASLAGKDVLLHEVHHRVKNNLQLISSLLGLQVRAVDSPEARGVLEQSRDRVLSMARAYDMLSRTDDLRAVRLAAYLQNAVDLAVRSQDNRGINAAVDVPAVTVTMDVAMACGLIVNELLANAFKHAFPAGRTGTVRVAVRRVGDDMELTVADDGVGRADSIDLENSRSIGLKLVSSLAHQIGGRLTFRGGPGVTARVVFPAKGR